MSEPLRTTPDLEIDHAALQAEPYDHEAAQRANRRYYGDSTIDGQKYRLYEEADGTLVKDPVPVPTLDLHFQIKPHPDDPTRTAHRILAEGDDLGYTNDHLLGMGMAQVAHSGKPSPLMAALMGGDPLLGQRQAPANVAIEPSEQPSATGTRQQVNPTAGNAPNSSTHTAANQTQEAGYSSEPGSDQVDNIESFMKSPSDEPGLLQGIKIYMGTHPKTEKWLCRGSKFAGVLVPADVMYMIVASGHPELYSSLVSLGMTAVSHI